MAAWAQYDVVGPEEDRALVPTTVYAADPPLSTRPIR
jgi:hypothetical protein